MFVEYMYRTHIYIYIKYVCVCTYSVLIIQGPYVTKSQWILFYFPHIDDLKFEPQIFLTNMWLLTEKTQLKNLASDYSEIAPYSILPLHIMFLPFEHW